jgi:hypothetical protein
MIRHHQDGERISLDAINEGNPKAGRYSSSSSCSTNALRIRLQEFYWCCKHYRAGSVSIGDVALLLAACSEKS